MLLMLIYQMMPQHSATTFTFDSPVYLQTKVSGTEYCIVFLTNSLEYRMWISQLGELDVGAGNRLVSRQPSLGVLFKSQTIEHGTQQISQDLKFTIHSLVFFNIWNSYFNK